MYAHFYQLSESPFNLTPDPKFHYVNESTREALASLLHGIKSRKGFITLIAEAGTGKTTLLRRVVEEVEGETQIVFVFNPGVSFDELLEFICTELGIETRGCKRLHLLDRLNSHLLSQLTAGRNVVVMIDEAQTLEDSVLEELRLLSNLETSKEKILQIVLSGQPELEEKLRRPGLRQLRQRIGVRTTLKPVQPAEMQAYVETRLRCAGGSRNDLFTPAALKKVWQASRGIPRVINVICDNAMMIAFAEGQRRITPKTLREAMRDLGADLAASGDYAAAGGPWWSSRNLGYGLAAAAVIAAAIPFAGVVTRSRHVATEPERVRIEAYADDAAAGGGQANPGGPAAVAPARPAAPAAGGEPIAGGEAAPPPGALVDAPIDPRVDADSLAALESDASRRQIILDSIRRAEVIARSTAARLYDSEAGVAAGRKDLAEAALDEVARDRELTGIEEEPVAGGGAVDDVVVDPRESTAAAELETATAQVAVAASTRDAETQRAVRRHAEPAAPVEPGPKAGGAETPGASARAEKRVATAATPKSETPPAAVAAAVTPPAGAGVNPTRTAAPRLGRSVVVREGDTVWDIAIRQYGEAGPTVLKRILAFNRRIVDPLKLEVGSTVFLPFSRADQMISRDSVGYRVLLAAAPSRAELAAVEAWAESLAADVRVAVVQSSPYGAQHELYVAGLASQAAALSLASGILEQAPSDSVPQRTAMR